MDEKKQKNKEEKQTISPLSQEMTYGERMHSFIFNNLINFWINLGVSAVFTYWVTHSQQRIKLGPIDWPSPSTMQKTLAGWIYTFPPMKVFGDKEAFDSPKTPTPARVKSASYLANVFTLVFAGHFIIVPSVWLGAKVKAPLVKFFNRHHYGDEAMESPDLQARHAAIELEERPTLLGAIVGRFFTIVATQIAGYSIGNETNAIAWIGKKLGFAGNGFPGIDKIIEIPGAKMGEAAEELFRNQTNRLDAYARDGKYNWSASQILNDGSLVRKPYANVAQHIGKYAAQDVMYTFITSLSINPVINVLKHVIPGLTYTPKPKLTDEASDPMLAAEAKQIHVSPNLIADRASLDETPASRVAGKKMATPLASQSPTLNPIAMV